MAAKRYKWTFRRDLGIQEADCLADYAVLEPIFLARPVSTHNQRTTIEATLRSIPNPFFLSAADILAEDPEFATAARAVGPAMSWFSTSRRAATRRQ